MFRWAAAGAIYLLVATVAMAQPSDDSVVPTYRRVYVSTIRCFVANGILKGDAHDVGRDAQANSYQQKAKQSFDLGFQAGRKIGLGDQRIQSDFDGARTSELPRMMRDKAYFQTAVTECKALGLM